MRNKLILTAAAVAAFAACSATVSAIPIDGFVAFGGTVTINPNSASLAGANNIGNWNLTRALDGQGHYAFVPLAGQPATMNPGWVFNSGFTLHLFGISNGADNWYYNADTSAIIYVDDTFLAVHTTGTLTGPAGFEPTPGVFNFTVQGPAVLDPISGLYMASWSGAAGDTARFQIPDGGSTLMLLGSALGALTLLRKRTAV